MSQSLPIIGWKERVDFPEWGLTAVLSKTDTGAQTSTIDASDIELLPRGRIRFRAVGRRSAPAFDKPIDADIVRVAEIRSSNGRAMHRYVVVTRVQVGEENFQTEFTLSPRPRMKCRVLLGRSALEGRFLVDSEHAFLLTKRNVRQK